MKIRQAITFDDVLLQPGASEVTPSEVDVSTQLTKKPDIQMKPSAEEVIYYEENPSKFRNRPKMLNQ